MKIVEQPPLTMALLSEVLVTHVNHAGKHYIENSRNKRVINFKLRVTQSSMMKSHALLPGTQNAPAQRIHAVCTTHPFVTGRLSVIRGTIWVSQCLSSGDPCFTYSWSQSTRVVVLAIWICHREALSASFK